MRFIWYTEAPGWGPLRSPAQGKPAHHSVRCQSVEFV
jgi:hypothetical protein